MIVLLQVFYSESTDGCLTGFASICCKLVGMKYIFAILVLQMCHPVYAFEPVSLRQLSLTHRTFKRGSRNPVFDNAKLDNREIRQELSLHFDTDFLNRYVFWDNHVMSYVAGWKNGGNEQFRNVGWEFSLGLRPCDWFQVGYYHYSKHVLDASYQVGDKRFPVEDALEVKVYFYMREK